MQVDASLAPLVNMYACDGEAAQTWTLQANGQMQSRAAGPTGAPLCLTATATLPSACTNVWGRPLADGSWAVTMVNNGAENTTVTCGPECIAFMNMTGGGQVQVRDLWAHAIVGVLSGPTAGWTWNATVPGDGGSAMFRFIPQ